MECKEAHVTTLIGDKKYMGIEEKVVTIVSIVTCLCLFVAEAYICLFLTQT